MGSWLLNCLQVFHQDVLASLLAPESSQYAVRTCLETYVAFRDQTAFPLFSEHFQDALNLSEGLTGKHWKERSTLPADILHREAQAHLKLRQTQAPSTLLLCHSLIEQQAACLSGQREPASQDLLLWLLPPSLAACWLLLVFPNAPLHELDAYKHSLVLNSQRTNGLTSQACLVTGSLQNLRKRYKLLSQVCPA